MCSSDLAVFNHKLLSVLCHALPGAIALTVLFLLPNQTNCDASWRDFNPKVYSLISLAKAYSADCWALPD